MSVSGGSPAISHGTWDTRRRPKDGATTSRSWRHSTNASTRATRTPECSHVWPTPFRLGGGRSGRSKQHSNPSPERLPNAMSGRASLSGPARLRAAGRWSSGHDPILTRSGSTVRIRPGPLGAFLVLRRSGLRRGPREPVVPFPGLVHEGLLPLPNLLRREDPFPDRAAHDGAEEDEREQEDRGQRDPLEDELLEEGALHGDPHEEGREHEPHHEPDRDPRREE